MQSHFKLPRSRGPPPGCRLTPKLKQVSQGIFQRRAHGGRRRMRVLKQLPETDQDLHGTLKRALRMLYACHILKPSIVAMTTSLGCTPDFRMPSMMVDSMPEAKWGPRWYDQSALDARAVGDPVSKADMRKQTKTHQHHSHNETSSDVRLRPTATYSTMDLELSRQFARCTQAHSPSLC